MFLSACTSGPTLAPDEEAGETVMGHPPPKPKSESERLIEEAAASYSSGDVDGAAKTYVRAYELSDSDERKVIVSALMAMRHGNADLSFQEVRKIRCHTQFDFIDGEITFFGMRPTASCSEDAPFELKEIHDLAAEKCINWAESDSTAYGGCTVTTNQSLQPAVAQRKTIIPPDRFVDNGDGTVTDTKALRMWQQSVPPGRVSVANRSLTGLSFVGYSDWRVPTLEDFRSFDVYPHFVDEFDMESGIFVTADTHTSGFVHPDCFQSHPCRYVIDLGIWQRVEFVNATLDSRGYLWLVRDVAQPKE